MGIYDTVTILKACVPKQHRGISFQTKDMNPGMDEYELRSDGFLWRRVPTRVWVKSKKSLMGGYLKETSVLWLKRSDIHGEVEVHTFWKNGEHLVYVLTFKKGKLVTCVRGE